MPVTREDILRKQREGKRHLWFTDEYTEPPPAVCARCGGARSTLDWFCHACHGEMSEKWAVSAAQKRQDEREIGLAMLEGLLRKEDDRDGTEAPPPAPEGEHAQAAGAGADVAGVKGLRAEDRGTPGPGPRERWWVDDLQLCPIRRVMCQICQRTFYVFLEFRRRERERGQ